MQFISSGLRLLGQTPKPSLVLKMLFLPLPIIHIPLFTPPLQHIHIQKGMRIEVRTSPLMLLRELQRKKQCQTWRWHWNWLSSFSTLRKPWASCEVLTMPAANHAEIFLFLSSFSSLYFLLQQLIRYFSFSFESSPLPHSYHSHLPIFLSPLPSVPSSESLAPSLPFFPSSYPSFTGKSKQNKKIMGNK